MAYVTIPSRQLPCGTRLLRKGLRPLAKARSPMNLEGTNVTAQLAAAFGTFTLHQACGVC